MHILYALYNILFFSAIFGHDGYGAEYGVDRKVGFMTPPVAEVLHGCGKMYKFEINLLIT